MKQKVSCVLAVLFTFCCLGLNNLNISWATPQAQQESTETNAVEAATVEKAEVTDTNEYILKNINQQYAKADKLEPHDILLVKQTMADAGNVPENITFDTLFSDEKAKTDGFITTHTAHILLYNTDDSSDYYVAYADTMKDSANSKVTDYDFAYTNDFAELLSDCIFDRNTGIAYIPKKYTTENKMGKGFMNVQIQLLQLCYSLETTVEVSVEEKRIKGDIAGDGVIKTEVTKPELVVQLAEDNTAKKSIKKEYISLNINGEDAEYEDFDYDESSGAVTVNVTPSAVDKIDIKVEKPSAIHGMLYDTAKAVNIDGMNPTGHTIEFNTKPRKGMSCIIPDGHFTDKENDSSTIRLEYNWPGPNGGWHGGGHVTNLPYGQTYLPVGQDKEHLLLLINAIHNFNPNSFDIHEVTRPAISSAGLNFRMTVPVTTQIGFSDASGAATGNFVSESAFYMFCGHVSASVNHPLGDLWDNSGGDIQFRIFDVTNTYVLVGVMTGRWKTCSQEGYGLFKIAYRVKTGNGKLIKKSSNAGLTDGNSAYTLSGAEYGVYTDYGCTNKVNTFTTNANGESNTIELTEGTYYVKELKAPKGYALDDTIHILSISGGQTTTLNVTDIPQLDPVDVMVGKIDKETNLSKPPGSASLAGAQFTIKYYPILTTNVSGLKPKYTWIVTTDKDGYGIIPKKQLPSVTNPDGVTVYGLPIGTLTIQETKAPAGYLIDNTVYLRQITAEGSGPVVDTYNQPIVPEQVIRGGFKMQKVDKDTNQAKPQGNAGLNNATFTVTNTSGQSVRVNGRDYANNAVCHTFTTDANGQYTSPNDLLPYGSYRINETVASGGYLVNTGWSATVDIRTNGTIVDITGNRVPEQVIRGGFKAQKVDKDTNQPSALGSATLAGAELEVINRSGQAVYTYMDGAWGMRQPNAVCYKITTNENGIAQSSADALPYGNYRIRETKAPTGYLLNSTWYRDFTISQKDTIVDISNTPVADQVIRGSLQLVKFREDNDKPIKTPLKDVEFTLTHKKTGEQVKIITDENGYAKTADNALVYGIWEVAETKTPSGYMPIVPFEIDIAQHNKIHYFIIENGTIRSAIQIVKTDSTTGNIIPLADTEFQIRNRDTNQLVEFTTYYPNKETFTTIKTGADGTCFLPQLLEVGNYEAIEIKPPSGYILSSTPVPFTVTDNRDYTNPIVVFVTNEPAKGKIKLEKTGEIYKGYSEMEHEAAGKILLPVFELGKLTGAEFEIKAAQDIITPEGTVRVTAGEVVDTIVTTDGEDFSKELFPGKYIVKETKAPQGYIPDATEHEVEITYQDMFTDLTIASKDVYNKWLESKVEIVKEAQHLVVNENEDKINTAIEVKPGAGFLFTLCTAEQIRDIPKDATVAYGFTNEEGKLIFEGKFPHGQYYIKELHTNNNYHPNDTQYPVDLTYAEDTIKIEVSHKVLNELKKKEVTIDKKEITGDNPVPGAIIEITDSNGQVVYRDVTDEDGQIKNIILVPGKYSFKETLAPNGFALNTAVMKFEVTDELEVIGDTTIKDEYTKIIFKKVGINDNPLPGAKFGLYKIDSVMVEKIEGNDNTSNNNVELPENVILQQEKTEEATYKETTYGQLIAEAISDENGIVTFEKIPFGKYLVKELEAPEGYQISDKTYHFSVDGSYVNPTEPVDTFINTRIMSIFKTDVSKSRFVPGSKIAVFSKNNQDEPIFKGITDENGTVNNIPLLEPGEYTFVETAAPEGFSINENTFTFTVDDKGKISGQTDFYDDITKIKILKTDTDTKDTLSGAKFGLYDENGTLIQEKVTDEQGIAEFSGMTFGKYSIKELEAPEGYKLSDRVITLIVNELWVNEEPIDFDNGKLIVGRITGKYNSGEVDDGQTVNVKTGDSNRIWLLLLFSGISLICGLCFWLLKRKKRGEKSDISK